MSAYDLKFTDVTGLTVGEYGIARSLTVTDSDGVAANISAYANTGSVIILRGPHGYPTKSYEPTFTASGDAGILSFTPAAGDIDRSGTWEIQVKLATASAQVFTLLAEAEVQEALV